MIGDPVHHSLSPVIHNAAYRAMGLDWVYVALPVAAGQAAAAVAAVRTLGLAGLSVTMPHKADAAAAVDVLTPTAARLGVVNTVVPGHSLLGDSTDGAGFTDALAADIGWDGDGRTCVVLGTGGAARAVVLALVGAGARQVTVVGRRADAAAACVAVAGPPARVGSARDAATAELVVNATSVGMAGGTSGLPLGLDPSWLGAGQAVVDLVYAPPTTPLLEAAEARGAAVANGLAMLVHQAARQISAWVGEDPPIEVMRHAAQQELVQ